MDMENTTTTAANLEAQAQALRDEASNIGDRYGNMGPAARKRQERLYNEARDLQRQADKLHYANPPKADSGIFCKGCDEELDNEGLYELRENEGYTGCCNKSTY